MFESIHVSVPKIIEFERSLNRADNITNAFIITAGDFNLPGCNWKTKSLKANTQHVNIHHKFTDILDDHGLVQMVEEPTRESNTLDLSSFMAHKF
jgi:hypothetical protein